MRRLYSFCVDSLVQSAQFTRNCSLPTFGCTLTVRVIALSVLLSFDASQFLFVTPQFCVPVYYSGSTFHGTQEGVYRPIVELYVLFCSACL